MKPMRWEKRSEYIAMEVLPMKKKLIMALTSVYLLLALSIPVHAAVTDTGFSDVVSDVVTMARSV